MPGNVEKRYAIDERLNGQFPLDISPYISPPRTFTPPEVSRGIQNHQESMANVSNNLVKRTVLSEVYHMQ